MSRIRGDIAFGLAWFVGLFGYDAFTSWWSIRRALRRVRHDPAVQEVVFDSVSVEVVRMFGVYVLMGLVAGGVVHLVRRGLGAQRAWPWRLGIAAAVVSWVSLRGAIFWPRMYVGGPGVDWLANHAEPLWIDAAFLVIAIAVVAWRLIARRVQPPAFVACLLALFLVGHADWHPPADTARDNAGPNVVLIGFDALRPDHMGMFGYHRDTTPALDAFLKEQARVYPDAFTPLARTWPAWSSILTGADPLVHGKRDSLPALGHERPNVPMITDVMRESGVHTAFVTDDSRFSYMLPEHNFDRISQPQVGIENFALSGNQPYFRPFFEFLNGPLGWAMMPLYRYNQAMGITHRPEYFAEHVADVIGEASEHDQFFVAAHFCTLHSPADRSYPWHRMYGMPEYEGDNRFNYRSTGSEFADGYAMDADELERLERDSRQQNIDLYDSGLAMIDLSWKRIERALEEGGLLDNTLVIVLSDHGEDFLEDDTRYKFRGPNHGFHPWGTGQNRVLLAMAGPGVEPGQAQGMASLVDVAPTVMQFMGLDFDAPDGRPLQQPLPEDRLIFGETGVSEDSYWADGHRHYSFERAHHRYTVDHETGRVYQRPKYDEETILAKDRWVVDDEWYLVEENLIAGPRYSLFRWREDPTMGTDVSERYPEEFARLVSALKARPFIPEHAVADQRGTR